MKHHYLKNKIFSNQFFLTATELAWQIANRKDQGKIGAIGIDILLMVENGIRGAICHAIHWYAKASNKYIKIYDKNKESSYLKYWDVINLHEGGMWQKVPVNGFKWVETTSKFNKYYITKYNEERDEGYSLEVYV